MSTQTLAQRTRMWEQMTSRLNPDAPDLGHTKKDHDLLAGKLAEIKELDDEQESLRGQRASTVDRRQVLELEASQVYSRLSSALKAHFGPTNELLREFGLTPRQAGRKAVAAAAAAEVPSNSVAAALEAQAASKAAAKP